MERKIAHIDMDAYFASIEQSANPSLRGKPVAVCGETSAELNWGRTIIVTASYEARRYGIKTGCSVPEARRLCPHINIVFGDHDKYIDTSLRIHKILLKYSDLVEAYSIDECFVDLTHTGKRSERVCLEIKRRIKSELGITCSIGLGPNKLIAKLASDINKPDGLTKININTLPSVLENLPVKNFCGIGDKTALLLEALGITTAGELGRTDPWRLKRHFGINGYRLREMGEGIDTSPVEPYHFERLVKSVGHSHTMPADTDDIAVIESYLAVLSEKVGSRLKEYGLSARTVAFLMRYEDFEFVMKRHTEKEYTDIGHRIFYRAGKLLKGFFPLKKRVRLLGVTVASLRKTTPGDYLLPEMSKEQKASLAAHKLNRKYGEFTVKPAVTLTAERFGMQQRCGLIGRHIFDGKNSD